MKRQLLWMMIAAMLCIVTVFGGAYGHAVESAAAVPETVTVMIDGCRVSFTAYDVNGEKTYSVRDMASALNGTSKQFGLEFDPVANTVVIQRGQPYILNGLVPNLSDGSIQNARITTAKLYADGRCLGFPVYNINDRSYMVLRDLLLLLDMNIYYDKVQNCNVIDTSKDFKVDVSSYISNGYFNDLHGAILGNSSTGEIIYSYQADQQYAIASISKLMTYLLVREAIDTGKVTWEDQVKISEVAQNYASSPESGVVPLKAGQKVELRDLVDLALIVSSNESSTALAEHLCGTEASFAELMNRRAQELGLTTAKFYNPHGLPTSEKRGSIQNSMSARDVFTLSSYIVNKYPEVLEITGRTEVWGDSLQFYGENTNGLLFKLPEVDGLKTGYTGVAGYCLTATMPVRAGGQDQRIIAVVLGGKKVMDRVEKTQVLLQYGRQYYRK